MNKGKTIFATLGFAAASAFTGTALAQAQETAWYAGASIGQMEAKDTCSSVTALGVSCDNKDTAWKIFGGYQFNRNIAAEIAYTDLGKVKVTAPGLSTEVKLSAWELVGVGSYPIGSSGFAPYAKLGIYRGKSDVSGNIPVAGDTSNDWTAGVGVRYDITRSVGLRAEWQRYNGDSDVDVLSIGALWKF
jgi:OOP family OmpA-OmpF porin